MSAQGDNGEGRGRELSATASMADTTAEAPWGNSNAGEAASRSLPTHVGRFEVTRLLGSGGLGDVYLSHHPELDIPVALKVLRRSMSPKATELKRFQLEARLAARIRHQNVVNVLELGYDDEQDLHFIVMEYVDGEDLEDRLEVRGEALPYEDALSLITEAARGLHELSKRRIVHRDIKPSNIILTGDGTVKLADLGVARALEQRDARLTTPDQAVGTPYYMSPEQVQGRSDVDTRSDIYSLGVTFYHLATGDVPFVAPNIYDLMKAIVRTDPEPPHKRNPSVPKPVGELICRMMAKDPDERPSSTSELVALLEEVAAGFSPEKREVVAARTREAKRRKPSLPVLVAPVIPWRSLGLVAGTVLLLAAAVWGVQALVGALGGVESIPLAWRIAGWFPVVVLLPWLTPFATDWALEQKTNWASLALLGAYTAAGVLLAACLLGFVFVPVSRLGFLGGAFGIGLVYNFIACEVIGSRND